MWAKSKFLKHIVIFAFISLVLSIGMAPAISFGNIFGSPKKQMDDGVATEDVLCRAGLDLMLRPSGKVSCVMPTSSDKLTDLGWETLAEGSPMLAELMVEEKTIEIDGLTVSYKEGGSPDSPTILLLHGFPTSSHMFRNLIPALEDEFHLVAPDYIGYGKSSMPSVDEFEYTFDNQADIVNKFTEELGLSEYSMYMMDYGAPVGFRLFAEYPERVQAFIIQNGNAYEEGLEEFWDDWKVWWNDKTDENEKKLHYLVAPDTTKWQYTFGMRNPNSIDPSTWITDQAGLDRPGNVAIQLAMAYDYRTNLPLYPQWQELFREYQPPTLIVWGANDYIFPEAGAHPYERDLTDVEKYILDTGHFALENDLDFIAEKISNFLNSRLATDTDSDTSETSESPAPVEETSGLSGEVKIGLILPLTGDLATHGIENLEGSKYGVIEFNNYLEEIGAPWHLKMVSEDSATSPVIALEKLTSLNAKGIGIVVGPETSSNIRNIKGYSDSNNMLLVSCCSSAPALAIPNDSVFRLVPDDRNQGTALSKLIQHEGIEVIVPVWRGDTWGDGLSEAATGSFVNRGGIIDDGIRYNPESPEFSASTSLLAEKVQGYVDEYGADKVAVLFLGFAEILQFIQSASQHDVLDDVRWFGPGANTKEHRLIEDPIGLEFSTKVQFTTVQFAASKNPIYEKVQEHLTETLGTDPNTFVHSSYDAVWLIGLAMLETQSTDVSTIKAAFPEIAENYSGAIGPTKLNEAGDLAQADYEIWGIRGGEWVLLGKYTQSDDSVTLIS